MVIYGNDNNLFQDISRIDHTVGDLALCKAFFLHSPSGGTILYLVFQKGVGSNTMCTTILFKMQRFEVLPANYIDK